VLAYGKVLVDYIVQDTAIHVHYNINPLDTVNMVGVNTAAHKTSLDINRKIKLGVDATLPVTEMIRWNSDVSTYNNQVVVTDPILSKEAYIYKKVDTKRKLETILKSEDTEKDSSLGPDCSTYEVSILIGSPKSGNSFAGDLMVFSK
jgi:hypothetical protein